MNNKQREHRRIWTEKEDEQLRQIVQNHPENKKRWNQIASELSMKLNLQIERTSKQCRERWLNLRNLEVQEKNPWTTQNDLQLIRACKEHGHRWAKLAQQIGEGRSDNTLKNNFYSSLRKAVRWINRFIKEQQKVYQDLKKQNQKIYNREIVDDFARIRSFQVKNISKVFSLVDSKQESRFDITEDLDSNQIHQLNKSILNFLEEFIQEKQQELDKETIVALIVRIMRINKLARVKYTKEIKLSVCDNGELEKKRQEKKKIQKKNDKIINTYLKKTNSQIIPAKRKKKQILQEIQIDYFHPKKAHPCKSSSMSDQGSYSIPEKVEVLSKKQEIQSLQKKNQKSLKNSIASSSIQKRQSFKLVDKHPMVMSGEYSLSSRAKEDSCFQHLLSKIPFVQKKQEKNENLESSLNFGKLDFRELNKKLEYEKPISHHSYNQQVHDQPQIFPEKINPFCPQPMKYSMEFDKKSQKKDPYILRSQNMNFLLAFSNPFLSNRVQNANNMMQSEPLSGFFNESQNYNPMFGSQQIVMRSCNYRESNPSSNVMHHSISFASSQENKSQKSKKQI